MKALIIAASAAALALAAPAAAQESAYKAGDYWTITMIDVLPGQMENYADYLAGQFKRGQDFAKSKGWIESYHVLANVSPRDGEPDIYLLSRFKEMTTRAENERRDKEYEAFMQRDARRLAAESGQRVAMRTQKGSMLLQEMNLKAAK